MVHSLMIRSLFPLLTLLLLATSPTAQPVKMVEVKPNQVKAGLFFAGEQITITGNSHRDSPPWVLIIGPRSDRQIGLLQQQNGIWSVGQSHQLTEIPGFIATAGTEPVQQLFDRHAALLDKHQLAALQPLLSPRSTAEQPGEQPWLSGYAELLRRERLYQPDLTLQLADDLDSGVNSRQLFSIDLPVPSNAPPGAYEVFLLTGTGNDSQISVASFELIKSGIVRSLAVSAFDYPLLYALGALLIAIVTGLAIGAMFNRR